MRLKKKFKKGSWTLFTVLIIPVLLLFLFFFVSYAGVKNTMKARLQNAVDSCIVYIGSSGDIYSMLETDENGIKHVKTYCAFNKNDLNKLYKEYLDVGIIKNINGYNDRWEIKVKNEDGENMMSFAELEERYGTEGGNYVLLSNTDADKNENISITITAVIPKQRITDYDEWYSKNLNSATNTSNWMRITVSSTVTCI